MDPKLKAKLTSKSKWLRLVYILLFLVITSIVKVILWCITALQFIIVLFTDKANERLVEFGGRLSLYISQVFQFLTYNSEEHPFPFGAWPGCDKAPVKKELKSVKKKEPKIRKKKK